jgi:hypothetical protein
MTNLPSKCADIKNKFPDRRMSGEDVVEEATEESAKGSICGFVELRSRGPARTLDGVCQWG